MSHYAFIPGEEFIKKLNPVDIDTTRRVLHLFNRISSTPIRSRPLYFDKERFAALNFGQAERPTSFMPPLTIAIGHAIQMLSPERAPGGYVVHQDIGLTPYRMMKEGGGGQIRGSLYRYPGFFGGGQGNQMMYEGGQMQYGRSNVNESGQQTRYSPKSQKPQTGLQAAIETLKAFVDDENKQNSKTIIEILEAILKTTVQSNKEMKQFPEKKTHLALSAIDNIYGLLFGLLYKMYNISLPLFSEFEKNMETEGDNEKIHGVLQFSTAYFASLATIDKDKKRITDLILAISQNLLEILGNTPNVLFYTFATNFDPGNKYPDIKAKLIDQGHKAGFLDDEGKPIFNITESSREKKSPIAHTPIINPVDLPEGTKAEISQKKIKRRLNVKPIKKKRKTAKRSRRK